MAHNLFIQDDGRIAFDISWPELEKKYSSTQSGLEAGLKDCLDPVYRFMNFQTTVNKEPLPFLCVDIYQDIHGHTVHEITQWDNRTGLHKSTPVEDYTEDEFWFKRYM